MAAVSPGALAKAASDRFSIVSAFPAALVVLMVFALIQTGGFPHRPHLSRLLPEHEQLGSGTVLFLALAVFILALTLQPFQLALVRLLEGYWGSWLIGRLLARRAAKPRQRRLRAQIVVSTRLRWLEPPELTGLNVDEQIDALRGYRRDVLAKDRADQVRLRYPRELESGDAYHPRQRAVPGREPACVRQRVHGSRGTRRGDAPVRRPRWPAGTPEPIPVRCRTG